MDKPTLFMSHSSSDKEYLRLLRDLIHARTSGTIGIFLSSDGQSIPFGANWVHTVETALNRASVMFVAVSPQSVDSPWIYFEAGFAYSRKIKVIPIGIMGVSIDRIRPPLSLLQGFNLVSHEGLSNLITIINREYQCSFPDEFAPQDFERLKMVEGPSSGRVHRYADILDHLYVDFPAKIVESTLSADLRERIEQILTEACLPFYQVSSTITVLNGARLEIVGSGSSQAVTLSIDPLCTAYGIPLIWALARHLYDVPLDRYWFSVLFQPHVEMITTDFKLSSRLSSAGIQICPEHANLFSFGDLLFTMDEADRNTRFPARRRPSLRVVGSTESKDDVRLFSLIDVLLDTAVIVPKG